MVATQRLVELPRRGSAAVARTGAVDARRWASRVPAGPRVSSQLAILEPIRACRETGTTRQFVYRICLCLCHCVGSNRCCNIFCHGPQALSLNSVTTRYNTGEARERSVPLLPETGLPASIENSKELVVCSDSTDLHQPTKLRIKQ